MSEGLLAREAPSLVARLRLWQPARWTAAVPPYGTRADVAHHLAQALVDLAGEAPGPLPRLAGDLVLPDQLAVTADDLVRTQPGPEVERAAVAHLLLHRADLLGEPVPRGLVAALGARDEQELLAAARTACLQTAAAGPHQEDRPPGGAGA